MCVCFVFNEGRTADFCDDTVRRQTMMWEEEGPVSGAMLLIRKAGGGPDGDGGLTCTCSSPMMIGR